MRKNRNFIVMIVVMFLLPAIAVAQDLPVVSLANPVTSVPLPVLPSGQAPEAHVMGSPMQPETRGNQYKQQRMPKKSKRTLTFVSPDAGIKEPMPALGGTLAAPVTVPPEVTTTIQLSSSDLNRIVCPGGDIKEALTSDEKGLMIKITGKDAFVKFKVGKMTDGKLTYSTTPTEIYMVCGGATYSMVAFPSRLPSQTIKLSTGIGDKIKENQALYAGLPFEKRILRVIKEIYTDNIPDSYLVTKMNQVDASWKGMVIVLRRTIDIEGEGLKVKEYHITLKNKREAMKLSEKMFLGKEFSLNPIAISIDKHVVRPGETSRLFVVEQRAESSLSQDSFQQLPTMSGESIAPHSSDQPEQGKDMLSKDKARGTGGAPKFNLQSLGEGSSK